MLNKLRKRDFLIQTFIKANISEKNFIINYLLINQLNNNDYLLIKASNYTGFNYYLIHLKNKLMLIIFNYVEIFHFLEFLNILLSELGYHFLLL